MDDIDIVVESVRDAVLIAACLMITYGALWCILGR